MSFDHESHKSPRIRHLSHIRLLDILHAYLTLTNIDRRKLQRVVNVTAVHVHSSDDGQTIVQVSICANFIMINESMMAYLQQIVGQKLICVNQDGDYSLVKYYEMFNKELDWSSILREIISLFFSFHSITVWRLITVDEVTLINLRQSDPSNSHISTLFSGGLLGTDQLNDIQRCSPHMIILSESKEMHASTPDVEDLAKIVGREYLLEKDSVKYDQNTVYEEEAIVRKPNKRKMEVSQSDLEDTLVQAERRSVVYTIKSICGFTRALPTSCICLIVLVNGYPITKVSHKYQGYSDVYMELISTWLSKRKISNSILDEHTIFPCLKLSKSTSPYSFIFVADLKFDDLGKASIAILENSVIEQFKSFFTNKTAGHYSDALMTDSQRRLMAYFDLEFRKIAMATSQIFKLLDNDEKMKIKDVLSDHDVNDENFEKDFVEKLNNNYCNHFLMN